MEDLNENVVEDVQPDNLDKQETTEPTGKVDNSEPDETNKPDSESTEELILGKFKTNEDVQTAFTEQEKQIGKMSNEIGELRKVKEQFEKLSQERNDIAKAYGFDSVEAMQQASMQLKADQDVVNFTADEYAKHADECEFPNEMRALLLQYKNNPSQDLLDTIEEEFSKNTLKEVAQNLAIKKGQLEQQKQQALFEQEAASVNQYLNDVTTKYADERYFGDEAFKSLFADLFKSFGTNLHADYAIEKLEAYVQSRISKELKAKALKSENAHATDAIEGLSGEQADEASGKSVLEMSEAELKKALRTKFKNVKS